MNQSEQINELAAALAKAQAEINPALKDSVNPFFKSKYADLSSVWSACRDALSKNGLAVLQTMDSSNGQLLLLTTLAHSSGQWIRSSLPIISAKPDAQSLGSAITYMRRYSLAAMVGVTTDEDDDGNSATQVKREIPDTLNLDQVRSLKEIFKQIDPAYTNQILKSLKVSTIEEIPSAMFQRIQAAALKKAGEYVDV